MTDPEKTSLKQSIVFIVRALRLIWNSSHKWSAISLATTVLRGAIPIVMLWTIKLLIDTVTDQIGTGHFDHRHTIEALVLTAVTFLLNSLSSIGAQLVSTKHGYCVNDHIARIIHRKSTKIGYGYFENPDYQDMFYRALTEASFRPQRVFYGIAGALQNALTLCLIGIILLSIHKAMPLMLIAVAMPVVIYRIRFSRKYFNLMRRQTSEVRKSDYYHRLLTAKEFAKEIRLFDLGNLFRHRYVATTLSVRQKQYRFILSRTVREMAMQVFMSAVLLAIFSYVIWRTIGGDFSIGSMAMYFMALQRGYSSMQEMLTRIASLYEDNLFLKNLFEYLDIRTSESTAVGDFPSPMRRGIEVRNVSFKYATTERTVLSNISFEIRPGETVAIVGANGSGKSTLIKLLCGLYEPTQGTICIDGRPLSGISRGSIAKNVSVIFQDFMLYNASARDNIWFGNIKCRPTDTNISMAASQAGIAPVFENLKSGYDTSLGNLFPDSEMLSQGEWQRTALARSFYNDSQIIILDEPTSSLDAFTESEIIDNFRTIVSRRTAIIVSHRLSTIKMADRVIVLKDNGIAEQGRLADLLGQDGYLKSMIDKMK